VRRAGFTGDVWPDEVQELLLQAALLPGDAGAAAWAAVRPRIDIDHLPGELHRLMPALSKTLASGGVAEPELPRLKGVYQYSWYRNQLLFADGAALVGALETVGIPTMLLRGAAMAVAYHGDGGIRPMNDLDLLVPAREAERARRAAVDLGWWPEAGSQPLEKREAAATLRNGQGWLVRLHWQPSRNVSLASAAWEPLWRRAVEVSFNQAATRVPSPADHLVLACVDGARANSGSSLRWIADAAVLLGAAPDLDWEVVVAEARRHHASLLLGEALRYITEVAEAKVPSEVVGELAAAPTTPRERLAHRLSLTTTPRVASAAELLGRFLRLTADLPLPRAVAAAPGFLQAVVGVERRRELPLAVARKAVRAVVSPTPPLATLSTAGPPVTGQAAARRSWS
jgi:hypothetical protein